MTDSEVIVVSLAIGIGIGVVLLMVLWACRACLGKSDATKDDNVANQPSRRQAGEAAQHTTVELASSTAVTQSPKAQRSHPPAAIQFPNEAVAPSPNMSVPSPGPAPTAPSPLSVKAPPQITIPGGPVAFASPSPLPTRLSDFGVQINDSPSPQRSKPATADSSTSAASSSVIATLTPGDASAALPSIQSAPQSSAPSSHPPSAAPTLAQLDPTVPDPTPMSGMLSGAQPQGPVVSPLPSGVPTHPSVTHSAAGLGSTVADGGVPVLNLDPVNDARARRHNAHPRTYPTPSSSAVGTTAELGPDSEASRAPPAPSTSLGAPQPSIASPGSYRMPAPLQTVSATHSLESQQAQVMAQAAAQEEAHAAAAAAAAAEAEDEEEDEAPQLAEESSTAVSDATVTVGGLTMREIVDRPQPLHADPDISYTAALEMATGVEAVECSGSFATACDDDSPGHELSTATVPAAAGGPPREHTSEEPLKQNIPTEQLSASSGTALLAHYEDANDMEGSVDGFESVGTPYTGLDTSRTVGEQSLAFMEGGQRHSHRPHGHFVPELDDLQGGLRGLAADDSSMNDQEALDLPPGAVMRGRDPLMDRLRAKLSQELPDGFSRTTSGSLTPAGVTGALSTAQSPLGQHTRNGMTASSDQRGSSQLSENYRPAQDWHHDSLISIPYNPASFFPGETDTLGNSVAISEASEWTLSAPTRAIGAAPSTAMSRGTSVARSSRRYVPGYADSLASGFSAAFSEASDWTLSGATTRQVPALRSVASSRRSPMPSPSTRSQLAHSYALTTNMSSRSGASSAWTLSGGGTAKVAPSQRFSHASRALDDGRSIAFTEEGSEWALSPRSTAVRDDVHVGRSERWMHPDDITVPARVAAQDNSTRGLRERYEKKTLRQKYASDDANVPEHAVRRVNDWMGAMESGTRDEVMLRLTAQQNGL